jgi:hypothetical protein
MGENPDFASQRHCCQLESRIEQAEELLGGLNWVFYDLQDRIAKLEKPPKKRKSKKR